MMQEGKGDDHRYLRLEAILPAIQSIFWNQRRAFAFQSRASAIPARRWPFPFFSAQPRKSSRMSQARTARIVGLSLAGLWLAISVLAAIAMDTTHVDPIETASIPSAALIAAAD
jgi:hypothetical protein